MAVSIGGGIVKDGLIFHVSQDSITTYRGKPTTNLFTSTPDQWSQRPAADKTILNETYKGGTVYRLADADGVTYGSNVDNYIGQNFTHGTTAGTGFTLSFDCRPITRSGVAKTPYQNCAWVWYSSNSQVVYFDDLPLNEWSHVTITCQSSSGYSNIYPRFDYDNVIVDIANVQFEQNDFATPYAGHNTSRTTSQVLYDTKGHTLTNAAATYNSDGTFSYTAAGHWATISGDLATTRGDITMMGWVDQLTGNGPHSTILATASTYQHGMKLMSHYHSQGPALWIGNNNGTGTYLVTHGTSIDNTGVHHIAATRNSATGYVKLYMDGVLLKNTNTSITGDVHTPGSDAYLGRDYHSTSYGPNSTIYSASAYNRVLSDDEIIQCYEAGRALRGL